MSIPNTYPFTPPKVKLETPVYHPNIDHKGNICLNILKEDWNPTCTMNIVAYGLLYLFREPQLKDPLVKSIADLMEHDID